MKEIEDILQDHHGFKRWFEHDDFDIILWFDSRPKENVVSLLGYIQAVTSKFVSPKSYLESQGITGFQVCYAKKSSEHAIAWTMEDGFSHFRVSSGKEVAWADSLQGDPETFLKKFKKAIKPVDHGISNFLIAKLKEYFYEFN